ncbi:MAG: GNAT family N-acetyltransferase [Candidatus Saccharibacteria bacterium]
MAITVTTDPTAKDLDEIIRLLNETDELTPRSKASLKSNKIAIARDENKIVGWLISEHLCSNVYEIGGAYIHPSYRRQGIFSRLIDELTLKNQTYVVASYSPYIINHFCNNHGYHKSSLLEITSLSRGKFITKRVHSCLRVASHLAKRQAIYIVRLAKK